MARIGPDYCETPAVIDNIFPVEPANAYSSMVIAVWGMIALWLVLRRAPNSYGLMFACTLLITNGVGSTLWHGLRTQWSLTLDVTPALIFVVVIAFLWARRLGPIWHAGVLAVLVAGSYFLMRYLDVEMPGIARRAASAIVVVGGASWLIARTWTRYRPSAYTGIAAVLLALSALGFRTADAAVCEAIGIGSHPLWHIFLSTAAFLAVLTVLWLEPEVERRREQLAPA